MAPKGTDPRIVDVPPGAPPGLTGARLLGVLAVAAVGLLFGSRAVADWAGRLPEGWEPVQAAAAGWDQAMERTGLTRPYDLVHAWVRGLAGGS